MATRCKPLLDSDWPAITRLKTPNKSLDRSHRRELLIKVIRFYHDSCWRAVARSTRSLGSSTEVLAEMKNFEQSTNLRDQAIAKCDDLFEHFDTRAHRYKRRYERYTYLTLGLTAAITVISALQALYKPVTWWVWVLPVVSGLATFCASMVHATNAHQLWLRARTMTQKLETERFLFTQRAGVYAEGDERATVE